MTTRINAIVPAYLEEPYIEQCVHALLSSEGVEVEVIVVDNGCRNPALERIGRMPHVTLLNPGENLGFGGGNNFGASKAAGDVLAFINGDALVDRLALSKLASAVMRADVGIASASLRLSEEPDLMNSAGNPVQFLGFSWAGGFREPAAAHQVEVTVASATGAAMAIRRELFERLGGFAEIYTAYSEDLEISMRSWQIGLKVIFVPEAIVLHHYEFARNPRKLYLTERNRLIFLLTVFARRSLILIAPMLVLVEIGLFFVSIAQGWWRQKLAGWGWLVRNRRTVISRRRQLQAARALPDRDLVDLIQARIDPGKVPLPLNSGLINWVLERYWSLIRGFI